MSEELADFAAAVHDVPELRSMLRNPQLEPRAKVGVLDELLGGADELVRNFLRLAAEKGRIGQIEEIARELLQQIEQASGRKIEATRSVDPSLIGGFVLQAGSMRVDASVRGRLEGLRQELVRGR